MMEEEPIDDLFKRKLEEADLSYREDYWLKALALIEADERKKKRVLFFWWTTAFSLFALLFIGWWFINKSTNLNTVSNNQGIALADNFINTGTQPKHPNPSKKIENAASEKEEHLQNVTTVQPGEGEQSPQLSSTQQSKDAQRSSYNSSKPNSGMRSSYSGNPKQRKRPSNIRGQETQHLSTNQGQNSGADSSVTQLTQYLQFQELAIIGNNQARLLANEAVLDPSFNNRVPLPPVTGNKQPQKPAEEKRKSRTDFELSVQGPTSSAIIMGLRRSQYLGNSFNMTMGISASSQHQLDQTFRWDSTQYSFGFNRQQWESKPIWMLEAIGHLGLTYQVRRSHLISFGLNWHLPLYGLEELKVVSATDFEQNRVNTNEQWGKPVGVNSIMSIQLGYEVAINSRMSFGLYWLGLRRQWQPGALNPNQDLSQLKLTGRWRIW